MPQLIDFETLTPDLLNPRNRGPSAAKRDNDNETGVLLDLWIYLLNCLFCYCYRFAHSLLAASFRKLNLEKLAMVIVIVIVIVIVLVIVIIIIVIIIVIIISSSSSSNNYYF